MVCSSASRSLGLFAALSLVESVSVAVDPDHAALRHALNVREVQASRFPRRSSSACHARLWLSGYEEVPEGGALTGEPAYHSTTSREPPVGAGAFAAKDQREPKPERAATGAIAVTEAQPHPMGVLPGLRTFGIAADEERRHSETLEIGHVERAAPPPGRERVVRLGPPRPRLRPAVPGWLPLHATSMAWASRSAVRRPSR